MSDGAVPFPVPPVVKTVVVRRPPETAFRLFTERLDAWWPLDRIHTGPDPRACAFEGRVGGRLYERAADGTETPWGTVLAWEPPHRVAFSWIVGAAARAPQRVEVSFTPVAAGTEVVLRHSGWEALGADGAALRECYDQGWVLVFEQCFAGYANAG
jgi:uncharacterized protein YndB with AHSA1/START domain